MTSSNIDTTKIKSCGTPLPDCDILNIFLAYVPLARGTRSILSQQKITLTNLVVTHAKNEERLTQPIS